MDEKIVKDSQGLVNDLANDCISRKAAIDEIFGRSHEIIKMRIGNLPSAQSELRRRNEQMNKILSWQGCGVDPRRER